LDNGQGQFGHISQSEPHLGEVGKPPGVIWSPPQLTPLSFLA